MFTPTIDQFAQIMPQAKKSRLDEFYPFFAVSMRKFGIIQPEQARMFLATVAHESGQLRYMKEIWGPTPAQLKYEGRRDLGNIYPGDGERFMGRGPIQITGRNNYMLATKGLDIGIDLTLHPETLEIPEFGIAGSCWFWQAFGCNNVPNFKAATLIVNGGLNGWDDRVRYYEKARIAIPDFGNVMSGAEFHDGP